MIALGTALLLAGCTHAAPQAPFDKPRVTMPAATADPQIRTLRAQLAQARAERDAALARLHAVLQRKPAVVRVVVRRPAPAAARTSDAGQSATQVFSDVSTASSP